MNKDHFWNIGANEDGHHQFAQMQSTNVDDPTLATNPTLATGMDLVYYTRKKIAAESTSQQDMQPFARTTGAIMQLLGIRAMALFDVNGTLAYAHNVTSVTHQATGRYSVAFTTALPSDNYAVIGGGMANTSNSTFTPMQVGQSSGASVAARKNTTSAIILCSISGGTLADPLQAWVIMFGG